MATKKAGTISKKLIVEKIQQVLWEKHLQQFPQGSYRRNPVIIAVKLEGNQQKLVKYKNDT